MLPQADLFQDTQNSPSGDNAWIKLREKSCFSCSRSFMPGKVGIYANCFCSANCENEYKRKFQACHREEFSTGRLTLKKLRAVEQWSTTQSRDVVVWLPPTASDDQAGVQQPRKPARDVVINLPYAAPGKPVAGSNG